MTAPHPGPRVLSFTVLGLLLLAACSAPAPQAADAGDPSATPFPRRTSAPVESLDAPPPPRPTTPATPRATPRATAGATVPTAPEATFGPDGPTVEALVLRIIDGDTIEVEIDGAAVPVRYIGIDTGETKHPSRPVEWMGAEAALANSQMVEGRTVILEKDVSEADRYGRLLRYVWLTDGMAWTSSTSSSFARASPRPRPRPIHRT